MLDYSVFFLIILILGIFPSIYYIKNHFKIEKKNEEKKHINKKVIYLTITLTLLNLIYFILFQDEKSLSTFIFLPIIFILLGGFIELSLIVYFLLIYNIFILFVYLKDYL